MKFSNLTYYLLTILCLMTTSCASEGLMDDGSINGKGQGELIEGGEVNFAMTFPTIDAVENSNTQAERTINDVQIYTFVQNKFVEKIEYVLISGNDGDATRNVMGRLMGTYSSSTAIDFVVIVNAGALGLSGIMPNQEASKEDLYQQLVFNYDTAVDWARNIPMWGEGRIDSFQAETVNRGSLTLERAIAKVNITVNDGKGLDYFQITEVKLHKYNTQGYCAPLNENDPSIPASSVISGDVLTSTPSSEAEANRIENKFYIPEHKNIDAEDKIYLVITATTNRGVQSYTIPFSRFGRDFDVLRNNLYVFNITGIKMGVTLDYEVEEWTVKNVDVPSFD